MPPYIVWYVLPPHLHASCTHSSFATTRIECPIKIHRWLRTPFTRLLQLMKFTGRALRTCYTGTAKCRTVQLLPQSSPAFWPYVPHVVRLVASRISQEPTSYLLPSTRVPRALKPSDLFVSTLYITREKDTWFLLPLLHWYSQLLNLV